MLILHDYFILQDIELITSFRVFESLRKGYLQGESDAFNFCKFKLENDIVIMIFDVDTLTLAKSNYQLAASAMDQIGLIGEKQQFINQLIYLITKFVYFNMHRGQYRPF